MRLVCVWVIVAGLALVCLVYRARREEGTFWSPIGEGVSPGVSGVALPGKQNDQPPPPVDAAVSPGGRLERAARDFGGRQVARLIRWRAETEFLRTHLDQDELIARFRDPATPLSTKRIDAWRLAVLATPEAFAALEHALVTGSPGLRAAAAEALGHSPLKRARDLLLSLADDPDPAIQTGVLRALALLGDDEAVDLIGCVLLDDQQPRDLRIEAARVLGNVESEAGLSVLLQAYGQDADDDLAAMLLSSLGKHPFPSVAWVFEAIVAEPDADAELKIASVEALADASGEAVAFLLGVAQGNADPDVRASAAWAAGVNAHTGDYAAPIARMLQVEQDPDVRRRLYEAMTRQGDIPASACLDGVLWEADLAAWVAGANAVAVGLSQGSAPPAVTTQFDAQIVPELLNTATSDTTLNLRLRAVFALRWAATPTAKQALQQIVDSADGPVAVAAQRGLDSP